MAASVLMALNSEANVQQEIRANKHALHVQRLSARNACRFVSGDTHVGRDPSDGHRVSFILQLQDLSRDLLEDIRQ